MNYWQIINLGRINLVLDDKVENEFRKAVADKLGMKKGNIQVAVEEALKDWVKKK